MERTERIEEEIKKIAGTIIDRELKDPRLSGIISVTKDEKEAMDALKSSAGYIRREIGKGIRMHSTPEVKFEMDDSMAYGEKIQGIINSLDIKPIEDDESADESDF